MNALTTRSPCTAWCIRSTHIRLLRWSITTRRGCIYPGVLDSSTYAGGSAAVAAGALLPLLTILLVVADLRPGRLVRPFALALETDVQMFLVFRPDRAAEPAVSAFREWLVAEARASLPEKDQIRVK